MPKRFPRGTVEGEMADTNIGTLFIKARSGRTLRVVEEMTGVNRETWRLVEVGEILRPRRDILVAATKLPGAPTYEELVAAMEQDVRASYLEDAKSVVGRGRRRGNAIA